MVDFKTIYDKMISRLASELPDYLTYHSVDHTKYVVKKSTYIAEKENLPSEQLYLLKIAALYHDSGFLYGPANHEEKSCELARKELKPQGFTEKQLDEICEMIAATRIPQQPTSHAAEILADADLEYLGTSKFDEIGELLYLELKHFNPEFTRDAWNDIQVSFIGKHSYHTKFCKRYKEFRKAANLKRLKEAMRSA